MSTYRGDDDQGGAPRVETLHEVENAPIACTLSGGDMEARTRDFISAFNSLVNAERFAHGLRWTFRNEPGFETALRDLARQEHDCCAFLTFVVSAVGEHMIWEIRGSAAADGVIDVLFQLPTTLRGDVRAVKRQAEEAGLAFVFKDADKGCGCG